MESMPLFAVVALAIGAVGAAVRNLQELLMRLDVGQVPEDEAGSETYGPRTAELVASLQMRLNLQPPRRGEVDDGTALAANEHAVELGLFSLVYGKVFDAEWAPAAGVTVRIHDADNLDGLACADVRTDEAGKYTAYYDPAFYVRERPGVIRPKDAIDLVVRSRRPATPTARGI